MHAYNVTLREPSLSADDFQLSLIDMFNNNHTFNDNLDIYVAFWMHAALTGLLHFVDRFYHFYKDVVIDINVLMFTFSGVFLQ